MTRKLLDLFCGGGGASFGYAQAGFAVHSVDLSPQPHYPFEYDQADALEYVRAYAYQYDVIHASPPCQRYSAMTCCRPGRSAVYPDLIEPTRAMLKKIGKPWIIENVVGAPLIHPIMLCGTMFGLPLYRHRLFESSMTLTAPPHPKHVIRGSRAGHYRPGEIISVCGNCTPIALARKAMGIDWMSRHELAESIPPAYTHHLGLQIMDFLSRR